MPEKFNAKRRFPRIATEHTVIVKKLGPDMLEDFSKIRVMGPGGCMFVSDEQFDTGTALELLIAVRGQSIKVRGRVVYEIPKHESEYEIGVEFVDISPRDRHTLESFFKS